MKILILPDLLNDWALHNRAKAIKKFLPEHEITIRPGLDDTNTCLADHDKFDVIHFNLTWGITRHTDFILKHYEKCLITIVNERSFLNGIGVDPAQFHNIIRASRYTVALNRKMAKYTGGVYIPNGIDEDLFNKTKTVTAGYAGTAKPNKNYEIIKAACEDLGINLRHAGYIDGRGQIKHEQMQDFYCGIDVYIHASETEGFSNVVLEALACNVPVLMTKQGAWQEFDGWVDYIEPTVGGIKKGLQKFTGRRLVNEKFLWKNIVSQYLKVYTEIYENNKRV